MDIPVYGYAEDALTYWALTQKSDDILHQLGDQSDEVLRIYRPSFGRGGRSPRSFGELDGILATRRAVYILETKWEGPYAKRRPRDEITLAQPQIRRHEVFRWYFETWLQDKPKDWADFLECHMADFSAKFPGKEMVRRNPNERLGANLEALLQHLTSISPRLEDVLLYFVAPEGVVPTTLQVTPANFRTVILDHPPSCSIGGFYFKMG